MKSWWSRLTPEEKIDAIMMSISLLAFTLFAIHLTCDPFERGQMIRVWEALKRVKV